MLKIFAFLPVAMVFFILMESKANGSLTDEMKCEGCIALASELHKKLQTASSRSRYTSSTALDEICKTENLVMYKYSPPKMSKACTYVIDEFEDELEPFIYKNFYKGTKVPELEEIEQQLCIDLTKLCSVIGDKNVLPEGIRLDKGQDQITLNMDEDGQLKPEVKTSKTKKSKNKKSKDSKKTKDEL